MKSLACSKLWTDISIKLNDQNLTNCCKYKALNQYTAAEMRAMGADAFSKNPELFSDKRLMTEKNELPKGCSDCSTNWPNSFWHIWNTWREKEWSEQDIKTLPEQDHGAFLEIYLSNQCNLTCMYCSEVYSSKWAQVKGLSAKKIDDDWGVAALEALIEYIRRASERKIDIIFLGGEPLMDVRIFELVEKLIEVRLQTRGERPPLFSFVFVTNLSVAHSRVERLVNIMERFPHVGWNVNPSIDAIGPLAENIRDGLNWDLFESNLDYLFTKNVKIILGPSMSALNIERYPQFIEWAIGKAKKFGKENFGEDWFIANNSVIEPAAMHPGILPDDYKKYIKQALDILMSELPPSQRREEHTQHLLNVKEMIGTRRQTEELKKSAHWYRTNGELKKKDYFKIFPILPEILGCKL